MIKVFTRFWKLCSARLTATILSIALLSNVALAQDQQISGTVFDETGAGLPGASVLIKGTSTGTVTDMDGKYSLSAGSDAVLVVSFIGYASQEVTVGSRSSIDVTLEVDADQLDEVIITGYSTDSRRETTGSVATVDSKSLTTVPSGNVEQQLQGRVAGVTVVTNGQPGTTSQVRVRGFGSFNNNQPLYVVDGVSVMGDIDYINPDDIESTTVLKDATVAAIYGARAAGGVIVISTKQGKKGKQKMEIEYNGMFGVTTPGNGIDMVTPQEHADMTWTAIRNAAEALGDTPVYNHPQYGTGESPVVPDYLLVGSQQGYVGSVNLADHEDAYNVDSRLGPIYQVVKANKDGSGTDWYDEITRNAPLQRHHLSMRGGGENSRYYFGMGMQKQDGILKHQSFDRYTFRANSEFDAAKILRVGENIQVTYRAARNLQGDNGGSGSSDDENAVLGAMRIPSIIPVYDEFGGYAGTSVGGFNNPSNPVADLDGQVNNRAFYLQTAGNVYLEIEPIEGLIARTSFGGKFRNGNNWGYGRRTYENSENNTSFSFNQSQSFNYDWQWSNTLNYKKSFGDHKVDVLLGQEALTINVARGMSGSGINPFSESVDYVSLNTVQNPLVNGGHSNGISISSYFARLNYSFNDKYFISGVVRRDGSSVFGSEKRYGTFPSVSAAWRISGESFMSSLTWLDDLKIRAGYGIIGNSNAINGPNAFNLYGTNLGASSYDIGATNSSAAQGYFRNQIGNPQGQWEEATTTNIGFDALLFGGKLDVVLDVWKKTTDELLFQLPITAQTGNFASAPFVNVASMENSGIDLKIVNKGNFSQDLKYEVTLNVGTLKNEVKSFAEGIDNVPGLGGQYRGINPVLNQTGRSISSFYGYQVQGLFSDAADVTNHATQTDAAPGRFKFQDTDGDGEITPDDRVYLGDPVPDFTGGLTFKLFYKGFELELYGYASVGNDIFNMTKLFTDFYPLFPGANIAARARGAWTPDNLGASIPIFENSANFSTMTQSSSYFVEDGSYFRLQNVTFTYNLPQSVLSSLNMNVLKVFVGVNNLFTITNYSGLDPSVGGAADTNFGIDLGNFPITRSYTLGVKAQF